MIKLFLNFNVKFFIFYLLKNLNYKINNSLNFFLFNYFKKITFFYYIFLKNNYIFLSKSFLKLNKNFNNLNLFCLELNIKNKFKLLKFLFNFKNNFFINKNNNFFINKNNNFFINKNNNFFINKNNNFFVIFKFIIFKIKINYFSTKIINFNFKNNEFKYNRYLLEMNYFINYYPISNNFKKKNIVKGKNYNSFLNFNNKVLINFLENFLKQSIFLKISNNFFKKVDSYYLKMLYNNYKYNNNSIIKLFNVNEFIDIIWYSIFLKDLSMLSKWVTIFLEKISFKFHKKFITFFQNFFLKHSSIFVNVLHIKGFYFDIRGKVGVTGSSKKRHMSFKIGKIYKSSKDLKINVNQNLVRTYSGVLGLTYILSY